MFVGGESNARGVGIGIMIMTPEGVKLEHSLRLGFQALNNNAEYEALITRLKAIKKLEVKDVESYSNSQLVVSQVDGSFEAKDSRMVEYLKLVGQLMGKFHKAKVIRFLEGKIGMLTH